jgi:hypothetical protein
MKDWDPRVVEAARMYLVEGKKEQTVLKKCGVTRRQLEPCVKEINRLLNLNSTDSGPRKHRSPRVENARKVLHGLFGRNNTWYGKNPEGNPQ